MGAYLRWLCCLLGLPWYSRPTPANIEEMPGRDVQVLIIGASPPEKSVTVDKDVETVRDFWTKRCGNGSIDVLGSADATRVVIEKKLENFVNQFQPNGWYLVHFSCHGTQQRAQEEDVEEDDGKNELVVASDGEEILDNWLRAVLVEGVLKVDGATLVAVFDCCTSGTILDLPHHRCNDHRRFSTVRLVVGQLLIFLGNCLVFCGEKILGQAARSFKWCFDCHGFCWWRNYYVGPRRDEEYVNKAPVPVLCISACPDGKTAWGNSRGGFLTRSVLSVLEKDIRPKLVDLQKSIDAEVKMHLANSREKEKKRGRGNELDLRQRVQFASFEPLDMWNVFSFAPRGG